MENMEEVQKLTVKEFHHWLKGVIDMQSEDWVPDAKQWAKILLKIYEIDDSTSQQQQRPPLQYHQGPTYRDVNHAPIIPQPIQSPPIPSGPSQIVSNGNMAPVIAQPLSRTEAPLASGSGQLPVKTPNIDGDYNTPFV